MKKSEYKKQLQNSFLVEAGPQTYTIIECKDKEYAKGGCTCCWYCNACGRSGCDNLIGIRVIDLLERVQCDLED